MTVEERSPKLAAKLRQLKSLFKLAPSTSTAPIVKTRHGVLRGRRVALRDGRAAVAFLGIPYARPPVGELRFRKSLPLGPDDKWEGVRSARHYGHRAVQRDFLWDALTEFRVGKSEDCLNLNVIAPAAPPDATQYPNGYAVMVYIHGGGFVMDSAAKYHYRNLARSLVRHDVVIVTIQYRLSYLGFFCTGDENAIGNYGLWDQVLALRWVRDNISQFGGDPNRVTVFGQSAGAVSADLLSIMPESRDLMTGVILMGGNAEAIWAISPKCHLVRYCRQKALRLGFRPLSASPDSDVNALADASADVWTHAENVRLMTFLRAQPAHKFESTMVGDRSVLGELRIPITPVFDGDLLPASIAQMRANTPPRRVIVGVSEFEGLLFLALGLQRVNRRFLGYCETRAIEVLGGTAHEFRQQYGITEESRRDKRFVKRACVDIVSDLVTNFALENYCCRMSANGSTIWRYVFKHHNPAATRALNPTMPFVGATHCTELVHLFDLNMFVVPFQRTRADRRVNEHVTRLWTNFAKYSNPNGPTTDFYDSTRTKRFNEDDKKQIQQCTNEKAAHMIFSIGWDSSCVSSSDSVSSCQCQNAKNGQHCKDGWICQNNKEELDRTDDEVQRHQNIDQTDQKRLDDQVHQDSTSTDDGTTSDSEATESLSDSGVSLASGRPHNRIDEETDRWLPYIAEDRVGHYVIAERPAFCDATASAVWRRVRALASRADRSTRYDA